MPTALLDGDIIAYRAAAAAQEDIEWGDGQTGVTVNTQAAIYNAQSIARTWTRLARADRAVLCLSAPDGRYFRRDVCPTYKADRRGGKPEAYRAVLDSLMVDYEAKVIPGLEADDVMGILSTSPKLTNPVIVSIDKDMQTIPGLLLNPTKDKRPRRVTLRDADRAWMRQTLMGDRIDGYPGIKGVGPKTAERVLNGAKNLEQLWRNVIRCYLEHDLTEADALMNARLARILRRDDYDKEKGLIYLWHPSTEQRTAFQLPT